MRRRSVGVLLALTLAGTASAGCAASSGATSQVASSRPTTGAELDAALRQSAISVAALPKLGTLLGATEDTGAQQISIDPGSFRGRVVGVIDCPADGGGAAVRVRQGQTSVLYLWIRACQAGSLSNAVSAQPLGSGDPLTLEVTADENTRYTVVLEQLG